MDGAGVPSLDVLFDVEMTGGLLSESDVEDDEGDRDERDMTLQNQQITFGKS
jgi:hypothetical protein